MQNGFATMSREPDMKALREPPCEELFCPQTTQTAYLLSQSGLRRPKLTLTRHNMLHFYDRFLECHLTATC